MIWRNLLIIATPYLVTNYIPACRACHTIGSQNDFYTLRYLLTNYIPAGAGGNARRAGRSAGRNSQKSVDLAMYYFLREHKALLQMYSSRSTASAGTIALEEILKGLLILQCTIFCRNKGVLYVWVFCMYGCFWRKHRALLQMYSSRSTASAGTFALEEILSGLLILQSTIFCRNMGVFGGNIGLFCKCTLVAARQAERWEAGVEYHFQKI